MQYETAHERYEKLKRVRSRLMVHFNRDDFDDYIQVANSLHDWIKTDPTVSREQRRGLESFVVPESVDWQICHQLANTEKHRRPRLPKHRLTPFVKSVHYEPGKGRGVALPPSMKIIGAGDEITIDHDGGRTSGLSFVARTFGQFYSIFEVIPIPLDQRVITPLRHLLGV